MQRPAPALSCPWTVALVLGHQTPVRAQGPASPGALRDIQPCSREWAARGQGELLEAGLPPPPRRPPTGPKRTLLVCFPGRGWGGFYKHKCQSSESSANTPGSCGERGQKGWSLGPGQGWAAGSEVLAPSSSLTVDTAGGRVGAEGARELSDFCSLLPTRVRGLRDTHIDTHRLTHTQRHTPTHRDTQRHA